MSKRWWMAGALALGAIGVLAALFVWKRRLPLLWNIPEAPSRSVDTAGWAERDPVSSVRVLYVGHSLIGPDIPVMSQRIAESLGVAFSFDAQRIDGGSLEVNWNHPERSDGVDARAALETGEYDALLVTEAVNLDDMLRWSAPAAHLALWAGHARAHRRDIRLFFYETWHDREESRFRLGVRRASSWRDNLDEDLGRWEHIVDGAERIDPSLHFDVVPGGQALAALSDAIRDGRVPGLDDVDALFVDTVHPSPLGAYFVSLVHVAVLARKSPLGATRVVPTGAGPELQVSEATAAALQEIAWSAARSYPRSGVLRPSASG